MFDFIVLRNAFFRTNWLPLESGAWRLLPGVEMNPSLVSGGAATFAQMSARRSVSFHIHFAKCINIVIVMAYVRDL